MKLIRTENYLINLDKCKSIHYFIAKSESIIYYETENDSIAITYDNEEQLKNDIELLEEFIGVGNLLFL